MWQQWVETGILKGTVFLIKNIIISQDMTICYSYNYLEFLVGIIKQITIFYWFILLL